MAQLTFRARKRRLLPLVHGLLAITIAGLALWFGWLVWFVDGIRSETGDATSAADAIVVLTGGSGRIDAGLALLGAGRAQMLFISGVDRGTSRAEIRRRAECYPEAFECCVVLGREATNTAGNAEETGHWMVERDFTSLFVVTTDFHLPRSLIEFRRVMPNVRLIAVPVSARNIKIDSWWQWPGTAWLISQELGKYLVSVARLYLSRGMHALALA